MSKINVNQTISEGKFNGFFFFVFIMCFLTLLFDGYDQGAYSASIPVLMKDTGFSATVVGAIASYGMFGMMLGGILFGMLSDRIGRKKTILIGATVYTIFTGLLATSNTVVELSVYKIVSGIGLAGLMPVVLAMVSEYSPAKIRSALLATVVGAIPLGSAISMLIGIPVLPSLGWRPMFLFAFIALILVPICAFTMPESMELYINKGEKSKIRKILMKANPNFTPSEDDEYVTNNVKREKASVKMLFTNGYAKMTLLFWITYIIMFFGVVGSNLWLPKLMVSAGYSLTLGLTFTFIVNICSPFAGIIFGALASKYGLKKVLMIISFFAAIFIYLLSVKTTLSIFIVQLILMGLCMHGTMNLYQSFMTVSYPNLIRGTGVGWAGAMGRFGSALGPVVGGLLIQYNLSLPNIYLVFALPLVVVTLLVYVIKPPQTDDGGVNSGSNATHA